MHYDPLEMEHIIQPILEDEADMVVGSRLKGTMRRGDYLLNKVGTGSSTFSSTLSSMEMSRTRNLATGR